MEPALPANPTRATSESFAITFPGFGDKGSGSFAPRRSRGSPRRPGGTCRRVTTSVTHTTGEDHAPPAESQLPDIYCPFPQQTNPHVGDTRLHLDAWIRNTGLVHRDSARERFEQADFGAFVGMVYPTADGKNLELVADWFVWLFLVDDQLDDGHLGRSPERVRDVVAVMRSVIEGNGTGGVPDEELPAAVVALVDLWERTTPTAAPHWRARFCRVPAAVLDAHAVPGRDAELDARPGPGRPPATTRPM